jgi:hypothetical protein
MFIKVYLTVTTNLILCSVIVLCAFFAHASPYVISVLGKLLKVSYLCVPENGLKDLEYEKNCGRS